MIGRIFTWAVLIAAGYWYWQGPHQSMFNPSPLEELQQVREDVELCIRGQEYQIGVGVTGQGTPEDYCARKHGVYRGEDGRWHSYEIDKKLRNPR